MIIEVEYEADPADYVIRDHLIHRLENPNCEFGMYRQQLLGALSIVEPCEVEINVKFEEKP